MPGIVRYYVSNGGDVAHRDGTDAAAGGAEAGVAQLCRKLRATYGEALDTGGDPLGSAAERSADAAQWQELARLEEAQARVALQARQPFCRPLFFSDRTRCICTQLRPGSSFPLSAPRFP